MASGLSEYKKREEEKKARQAGNLAPEIDAASGKMINPHNPEYITKRPWYLGESGPSLNHHARQRDDSILSLQETEEILARQPKKFLGRATVFRKGACENCGAMTHKKKDCVERPRSLGKTAKVSGMDIAPDEASRGVQEGKLGWDGKRDQWAGYRAEDHERVIERYAQMEEERKRQAIARKAEKEREKEEKRKEKEAARLKRREEKVAAKRARQAAAGDKTAEQGSKAINQESRNDGEVGEGEEGEEEGEEGSESESGGSEASDSDSDYDSDEEDEDEGVREYLLKDKDNKDFQGRVARQGGVGGAQMKVSVRNLRIREDTAKYLRNLDPNSAYYDPKTRAMRDNPLPGTHPEELAYAGDNYVRTTGDTVALARMQVFALEAQEEGIDVHAEANPTAAILAKKRFEEAQGAEKEEARKRVMEAYGAEKYSKKPDPRLLLGQTEAWTEYSKDGRLLKGAPRAVVRSKYEEDVQVNNHTTVWGSYYEKKSEKWGYGCCHSLIKQSYCTGEEGRRANEVQGTASGNGRSREGEASGEGEDGKEERRKKSKLTGEMTTRAELYGTEVSGGLELDAKKLKDAVQRQRAFQEEKVELDERRRGYNTKGEGEVTKEEMEAYRLVRRHGEDPMARVGSDELLEH